MENKIDVIGIIVMLTIVFAGVGVYTGEKWLSHSELKQFVLEMNETIAVYQNTLDDTRIDIIMKNDKCDYLLLKITDDKNYIKCGWYKDYEFNTYVQYEKTYGVDENLTHKRKVKSISINLINKTYDCSYGYIDNTTGKNVTINKTCQDESHIEIHKETEYYKGGQSKTGGLLKEIFIIKENSIKLNYEWYPTYNEKSIIKLCFDKFDETVLKFDGVEEYDIKDSCYYYGYESGNLTIDPWWNEGANLTNTNCTSNEWTDLDNGSSTVGYDTSGSIRLKLIAEDNLVSSWFFNSENTTQIDEKCTNDGTVNGATYTASGKIGGAYDFDGTGDYISVPDFSLVDGMSISFWYSTTTTTNNMRFFNKGDTGGAATDDMILFRDSSGRYDFRMGGGGSDYARFYGGTAKSDGNWHHIVIIINSITDVVIYEDNVSLSLTYAPGGNPTSFINTARPLWIAGDEYYSSLFFIGKQDEWAIWNKALTQTEITELYNLGASRVHNTSANEFYSIINDTGSAINWIVPTLNITGNGFNVSYRVSTDNRSTFTNYLTDANNSENITVTEGQWVSFDFNLSGNATNSPTIENFGLLSGLTPTPTVDISDTYCSGQSENYTFDFNISLYDYTSDTLNETNVLILNLDECLFNLTNNGTLAGNFTIKINATSTEHNMTCIGNNTVVLTTSFQTLWTDVSINSSRLTNCTMDFVNTNMSKDYLFEVSFNAT